MSTLKVWNPRDFVATPDINGNFALINAAATSASTTATSASTAAATATTTATAASAAVTAATTANTAAIAAASSQFSTKIGAFDPTLKFLGGVGDGVADDTTAVLSASGALAVGKGNYKTTVNTLAGLFYGRGQVLDSAGNKRAPHYSNVTARPSALGNNNSVLTAFNGDLSQVQWACEHRITGTATLGQPTTGYLVTPETAASFGYFYNTSGWNQDTADNIGRTGSIYSYLKMVHAGQGDAYANFVDGYVVGAKVGATSFLANPAATLFGGQLLAGNAGVYLQGIGDIDLSDNGFDVAAIGQVFNLSRTVATGALGATWIGYRVQSTGSQAVDAFFSATGLAKIGLDFVQGNFVAKGAIALKSGDRIYLNATNSGGGTGPFPNTASLNGEFIDFDGTYFRVMIGNSPRFSVGAGFSTAWETFNIEQVDTGVGVNITPTATPGAVATISPLSSGANGSLSLNGLGTGGVILGLSGGRLGYFGFAPVARATITGSRGGNAALASFLAAEAASGRIVDSTTA